MDLLSITHFLNGFLMIALPVILGIYLISKFRGGWKYVFIGGATFILSQVFHIPFNSLVLNPQLLKVQNTSPGISGTLLIAAALGLSAGVFESFSRYAMYRWWIKDARSWKRGVLAGAGHGGVEAILLGIIVLLTYGNMMAYRNIDLSALNLVPDQLNIARLQIQTYWSLPWYDTLLGAAERLFTLPFHIAASVLVLQVFTRRPGRQQLGWLGLAILLHALMDASAVFISRQWGVYLTEAVLAFLAILDILIIFALRQPEPEVEQSPTTTGKEQRVPGIQLAPVEETSENLENTRYL